MTKEKKNKRSDDANDEADFGLPSWRGKARRKARTSRRYRPYKDIAQHTVGRIMGKVMGVESSEEESQESLLHFCRRFADVAV